MLETAELAAVVAAARVSGVDAVIRWLRSPNPVLTARVLRRFGATIGDGVTFKGAVLVDNVHTDEASTGDFRHLTILDNCYVGESVYLDLAAPITVGPNAMLSARAAIVTHRDVNRSPFMRTRMPRLCEPVTVCDGAAVSVGATMLAGSTLAANAVLAAGALLRQGAATEPARVYGGVPATEIAPVQ